MRSINAFIVYTFLFLAILALRMRQRGPWTLTNHQSWQKVQKKVIHHSYQPFASIAKPKVPKKLSPSSPDHNFLQALNAIQSFAARALYPVVPDSGLPV